MLGAEVGRRVTEPAAGGPLDGPGECPPKVITRRPLPVPHQAVEEELSVEGKGDGLRLKPRVPERLSVERGQAEKQRPTTLAGCHVVLVGAEPEATEAAAGLVADLRRQLSGTTRRLTLLGGRARLAGVLAHRLGVRPDVVVAVIPSRGGAVAAAALADRYRVPLVAVIADPARRDGGARRGLAARLEAVALRRASRVVVIGTAPAGGETDRLVEDGIAADRVDVLPAGGRPATPLPASGAPTDGQSPGADAIGWQRTQARARLGWDCSGFLVVQAGAMGFAQDLPNVVRCARELERRGRGVTIALVGDGGHRRAAELAAADLSTMHFERSTDPGRLRLALAAADLLLISERSGLHCASPPPELPTYLAAGRPIVAAVTSGCATGRALQRIPDVACFVEPGQPWQLADAIDVLRLAEHRLVGMAAAAHRHASRDDEAGPPLMRLLEQVIVAAVTG